MANLIGDFISWITGVDLDAGRSGNGLTVRMNGEDLPIPVVYGQRRVAPIRIFGETQDIAEGLPNEIFYFIGVLCHGEVESIGECYVNGEPLVGSKFDGLIDVKVYYGTDTQTADPTFVTECEDWTNDHDGAGIAYVAVKMRMPDWGDKNPFLGGMPEFSWLVRGTKVYDPRKDSTQTAISGSGSHRSNDKTTWEWSDNPSLCLLNYLTSERYGKGLGISLIDIEAFADAADTYETSTTVETGVTTSVGTPTVATSYDEGGTVNMYYGRFSGNKTIDLRPGATFTQNAIDYPLLFGRYNKDTDTTDAVYAISESTPANTVNTSDAVTVSASGYIFTCNAILDTGLNIMDNVKKLLVGCRGYLPFFGGKYALYLDTTGSSQMSFTTSNMVGGIDISFPDKAKKYNQVRAKFPDPKNDYKNAELVWPAVGSSDETDFLAEDNGEPLVKEVTFETIASQHEALNMAKAICLHSRYNTRVSFDAFPEAAKLAINDVIDITHPTPAWTSQTFKVESIELKENGLVGITAREYNAGVYAYDTAAAKANRLRTDLPDAYNVTAPTSLVLSDTTALFSYTNPNTSIVASWTGSTDRFVREYEVQWKKTTDSDYKSFFTPNTQAEISGLDVATYDVRVRAINGIGSASSWISDTQSVSEAFVAVGWKIDGAGGQAVRTTNIDYLYSSYDFARDGLSVYAVLETASTTITLHKINLTDAWNLSTISSTDSTTLSTGITGSVSGIRVNADEDIILLGKGSYIIQVDLSTPGDISTKSLGTTFDHTAQDTASYDFAVSEDENTLILLASNEFLYRYNISAFDIGAISYASDSFDIGSSISGSPNPRSINIQDEFILWSCSSSGDVHLKLSLAASLDVSTASVQRVKVKTSAVSGYGASALCRVSYNDGHKMWLGKQNVGASPQDVDIREVNIYAYQRTT